MKKLLILTIAGLIAIAGQAMAAPDISGVYEGESGTITIKKAQPKLVKVKPEFQGRYNMGFGGEFAAMPDKLSKAKSHFTDTGQIMPDAYLVTFNMAGEPECPLTWKNETAQYNQSYLEHRDIDDKYFSFYVEGDVISLNIPMNLARKLNKCFSGYHFVKKK